MDIPRSCDVLVIGSGAAGACVTHALASKPIKVVVVEKGDWHQPSNFDDDELHTYILKKMWPDIQDEYSCLDSGDNRNLPSRNGEFTHRMGQSYGVVGGGTVFYAGVSPRFRLADFKKQSLYGGVADLCDWPKDFYEELEPYYTMAEKLIGVSGDHRLDPTSPPISSDVLLPPLESHAVTKVLESGARRLNWNPHPIPTAINSTYNRNNEMSWCVSSGLCSGYPCVWNAKNSVDKVLLQRARSLPNVSIVTKTVARRIEWSKGRCTRVVLSRRNESTEFAIRAKVIVLAASGIVSPLILLNSQSVRWPSGLGNANGLVGRFLMFHIEGQKGAVFENTQNSPIFKNQKKTMVSDFYLPKANDGFANHMTLQAGSKSGPIRYAISKRRGWGEEYLHRMTNDYMKYHELQAMVEDLPQYLNRVTASNSNLDVDDIPCARITHRFHEQDGVAYMRALERLHLWLEAAGGKFITPTPSDLDHWMASDHSQPIPRRPYGYHPMGTLRMHDNPKLGVVNRDCQFHHIPNLFCADSSIFPTSAAVNPTLTIQANAFRVADRIIEKLNRGEL